MYYILNNDYILYNVNEPESRLLGNPIRSGEMRPLQMRLL